MQKKGEDIKQHRVPIKEVCDESWAVSNSRLISLSLPIEWKSCVNATGMITAKDTFVTSTSSVWSRDWHFHVLIQATRRP